VEFLGQGGGGGALIYHWNFLRRGKKMDLSLLPDEVSRLSFFFLLSNQSKSLLSFLPEFNWNAGKLSFSFFLSKSIKTSFVPRRSCWMTWSQQVNCFSFFLSNQSKNVEVFLCFFQAKSWKSIKNDRLPWGKIINQKRWSNQKRYVGTKS